MLYPEKKQANVTQISFRNDTRFVTIRKYTFLSIAESAIEIRNFYTADAHRRLFPPRCYFRRAKSWLVRNSYWCFALFGNWQYFEPFLSPTRRPLVSLVSSAIIRGLINGDGKFTTVRLGPAPPRLHPEISIHKYPATGWPFLASATFIYLTSCGSLGVFNFDVGHGHNFENNRLEIFEISSIRNRLVFFYGELYSSLARASNDFPTFKPLKKLSLFRVIIWHSTGKCIRR